MLAVTPDSFVPADHPIRRIKPIHSPTVSTPIDIASMLASTSSAVRSRGSFPRRRAASARSSRRGGNRATGGVPARRDRRGLQPRAVRGGGVDDLDACAAGAGLAALYVLERRHSMPDGSFCVPEITVLNRDEQPLAFIEVVHTHEPERAVAIAGALDIPLFIVPAPGVPMVRPPLQLEPLGVQTDEDRALFAAVQAFNEAPGSDVNWRFSYETVEDEHGRQVPWRFSGSAPSFGDGYPLVGMTPIVRRS